MDIRGLSAILTVPKLLHFRDTHLKAFFLQPFRDLIFPLSPRNDEVFLKTDLNIHPGCFLRTSRKQRRRKFLRQCLGITKSGSGGNKPQEKTHRDIPLYIPNEN